MILFFKPVLKETLWGGKKLRDIYHDVDDIPIGECYGLSSHENSLSFILNGPFSGKSLTELWKNHKEIFGNYPSDDFPITVKLIDAFDDLSIQVTPFDAHAKSEKTNGKNKFWYIIDADPYTDIIIGHNAKNKAEFMNFIERNDYHHLIRKIPISAGDSFFIEPGTLNAISKGTFLLEVQQKNDTTYRFYDYDRTYHGKKRELHVRKALNAVKIPNKDILHEIKDTNFYVQVKKVEESNEIQNNVYGMFFVCISGEGTVNDEVIKQGDFGYITPDDKTCLFKGTITIALINLK